MKKRNKKIFADRSSWTFDKNVAKKFDYHINKSIPLYKEFQWIACQLSDYFVKENSIVYDVGCSTGTFLKILAERHKNKKKIKFYGLDVIKSMTDFAIKKNNHKNIKYINKDISNFNFKKSDLIISFYTIQFIHSKKRQNILNKIYKNLNWEEDFSLLKKFGRMMQELKIC